MQQFNSKQDLIAYVAERAIAAVMEDGDANEEKVREMEYTAAERRVRFWDAYSKPKGAKGMGGYAIDGYGYTVIA